jgi:hypothetical protein
MPQTHVTDGPAASRHALEVGQERNGRWDDSVNVRKQSFSFIERNNLGRRGFGEPSQRVCIALCAMVSVLLFRLMEDKTNAFQSSDALNIASFRLQELILQELELFMSLRLLLWCPRCT